MLRAFGFSKISMIDVRAAEAFKLGHLPASMHLSVEAMRDGIDRPDTLAAALTGARVNAADEAVVISDGGITPQAALAYLLLEVAGQSKVSILLDSVDNWGLSGLTIERPSETGVAASSAKGASAPYVASTRPGLLLREPPPQAGLYERVYIDSGLTASAGKRDGKIVHIPYTSLLNADRTPMAAKDIWRILNKAGVPRYAEIICVAGETADAAVNYVLLKMMGFPDLKVLAS